jgi:hypothetical protein
MNSLDLLGNRGGSKGDCNMRSGAKQGCGVGHSHSALVAALLALAGLTGRASAADAERERILEQLNLDIYGFVQMDMIYDFNRVDPDWNDTLRPSKIPNVNGEFGDDGETIFSVRQTRMGLKGDIPTELGGIKTWFEWELYGVGSDAGQTTFRLRHAWGEFGGWGAGQTWSLFMDENTFPNTIDYWGPNGMVFYRNIQLRHTWQLGEAGSRFAVALERPGTSVDTGEFRNLSPAFAENVQGRDQYPDLTAQYRSVHDWGHWQVAGILRRVGFETKGTPGNDPSDDLWGGGINISTVFHPPFFGSRDQIKLQLAYGEAIGFYMNDGGIDLAPESGNAQQVELLGFLAYWDHYWNDKWSTSAGWSIMQMDTTDQQLDDEFKEGQYANLNLLYAPVDPFLTGVELVWGRREDKNGETNDDSRVQFSMKYKFQL